MASQRKTTGSRDGTGAGSRPATGSGRGSAEGTTAEIASPRRAERRPEIVRQRRDERRQAYEKQRRQWLITRIAFAALGLLVVVGVAFGLYRWNQDQRLNTVPEGVRNFQYAGSDHTRGLDERVDYAESPPVGGRHAPSPYWQNCGYYDAPIQNESAVHSLEHGAVWITYRPGLSQEQIDVLREKAEQSYILVSPYEDQEAPVIASSWNHQLALEGADDERLDQFIRSFREGPDTPERGAACSGGVGTPQ
jgi:hypothetical protein